MRKKRTIDEHRVRTFGIRCLMCTTVYNPHIFFKSIRDEVNKDLFYMTARCAEIFSSPFKNEMNV